MFFHLATKVNFYVYFQVFIQVNLYVFFQVFIHFASKVTLYVFFQVFIHFASKQTDMLDDEMSNDKPITRGLYIVLNCLTSLLS